MCFNTNLSAPVSAKLNAECYARTVYLTGRLNVNIYIPVIAVGGIGGTQILRGNKNVL